MLCETDLLVQKDKYANDINLEILFPQKCESDFLNSLLRQKKKAIKDILVLERQAV
jgi:hypothetical protein